MGKLTAAKVRSIASPGLHGDGGTLYLKVAPGGTKSWIQRLTIDGRRRDIGLGGFPLVNLAEARDKAFENRRHARRGGDPLAEKRKARVPTFREAALKVFEANKPRWRNGHHTKSWLQTLERHAMPHIGDMPVDRIGREDVLRVLTPIWGTRIETARRVRQRTRTVLAWAQAHGYIAGDNAAGEGIDGALPAMPAVKEHFRALPYNEVPDVLCLTPVKDLSPAEIRAIRLREQASQAVFARYLNVTPGLVSQWERGTKRPRGASLKLLTLVAKKGLQTAA